LIKCVIGLEFIGLFLKLTGLFLNWGGVEKKNLRDDSGILDDNSSGWAEKEKSELNLLLLLTLKMF